MESYQQLVSATADTGTIFVSSNGRPNYNSTGGTRMQTQHRVGASLPALADLHTQTLSDTAPNTICIDSFDIVGTVLDCLSTQFFTDKINRGIYQPVEL